MNIKVKMSNNKKSRETFYRLILVSISILLSLFGSEIVLRLSGEKPGHIAKYKLMSVDKLIVHKPIQFISNSEGIFKANLDYKWSKEFKINSDGFRSGAFSQYETKSTKILFLGDSFTWGSGNPITNSFVDIVSEKGFITYNTGIPGVALDQYFLLAEKYIPLLKPNIVALMFCMENDFTVPYKMLPNKNRWHVTNAGWLSARDENGNYLSPQGAYKHFRARIYGEESSIQKLLFKTVIGTYTWSYVARFKWKFNSLIPKQNKKHIDDYVYKTLLKIKTISKKNNAKFMLFLLPAKPSIVQRSNKHIEDNMHIFSDFSPLAPNTLTEEDYLSHGHFNKSGNLKYAEFIITSIGFLSP